MPGADNWVQGGEEQDVPSRSAPMDGSLTGNPLERSCRAAGRTSRRSQEQAELPNWSTQTADNNKGPVSLSQIF